MPKFAVAFSPEADAIITDLADKQNTTKADIVRKAVSAYKWLDDNERAGSKVLVETKDGKTKELTRF